MALRRVLFLIIASTTLLVASADNKVFETSRPFFPRAPTTFQQKALSVRGGAGPLNVDDVAKAATVLRIIDSVFISLAPKKAAKAYGVGEVSPMREWLLKDIGATFSMVAVQAWCLFFGKTDINTAVGAGCLPLHLHHLRTLLNNEHKELGMPAGRLYITLAIDTFCSYALLTNATYAASAMKGLAIWKLVNGLLLSFAPKTIAKSLSGSEIDDVMIFIVKCLGFFVLSYAVFTGSLAMGVDSIKAFGYAWCPTLILQLATFVFTGEYKKFEMNMGIQYFWMLLTFVLIGTLAF